MRSSSPPTSKNNWNRFFKDRPPCDCMAVSASPLHYKHTIPYLRNMVASIIASFAPSVAFPQNLSHIHSNLYVTTSYSGAVATSLIKIGSESSVFEKPLVSSKYKTLRPYVLIWRAISSFSTNRL